MKKLTKFNQLFDRIVKRMLQYLCIIFLNQKIMNTIKTTRKETTFSEMKEALESPDTIILNEKIKKRVEDIKSRESIMARKKVNKRNEISELLNKIQNWIIMFIIIWIMIGLWLVLIPKTNASYEQILTDMNLNNCRVTQNEDSHIKKGNGSMYAYDIACIRWRSFEVYTPTNRNIYILEKKGYDKRLGNFIVLKHWDLRWVYAHTITDLNELDVLKGGQLLGKTNISWISQNYHLHVELWAYKSNIKFDYLNTKIPTFNPKSFDLRLQRNIVSAREKNEKILDFIAKFEWLELQAYDDWKQYSIWYGTYSYRWEVITKQQAKDRARIKIQSIREKYNLDRYSLSIQTAVVSFAYNIGSLTKDQLRLLENWFYKALWNDFKLYNWYYKNWVKIVLSWLVKRRESEDKLLKI